MARNIFCLRLNIFKNCDKFFQIIKLLSTGSYCRGSKLISADANDVDAGNWRRHKFSNNFKHAFSQNETFSVQFPYICFYYSDLKGSHSYIELFPSSTQLQIYLAIEN